MKKQICILTKSLKDHDYCVAGIDITTGKWIRLVTSKDGGAFLQFLMARMIYTISLSQKFLFEIERSFNSCIKTSFFLF